MQCAMLFVVTLEEKGHMLIDTFSGVDAWIYLMNKLEHRVIGCHTKEQAFVKRYI